MSDLYNRIYDLCQERNISVGKMCNELGISRGNLTELKMDRIKTLKADNLTKISGFFGVSIDYLLGTETKKAPTQEGEREIGFDDFTYAFYVSIHAPREGCDSKLYQRAESLLGSICLFAQGEEG